MRYSESEQCQRKNSSLKPKPALAVLQKTTRITSSPRSEPVSPTTHGNPSGASSNRDWAIQLAGSARREMRLLPDAVAEEAGELIEELTADPFQLAPKPLRGYKSLYSVRFHGDQYRIVFVVSETQRKVFIRRIRPRSTAYKGLKSPGESDL